MTSDRELEHAVGAAATVVEGRERLSCTAALELAARFAVDPAVIGKICGRRRIKIVQCQLGCFK